MNDDTFMVSAMKMFAMDSVF